MNRTDLIFAVSVVVAALGWGGLTLLVCRLFPPQDWYEPFTLTDDDLALMDAVSETYAAVHFRVLPAPPFDWANYPDL